MSCALTLITVAALGAGSALAEKPPWAGNQKGGERGERVVDDVHVDVRIGVHFDDRQRTLVRDFYGTEFRNRRCPPGLRKKRNGCLPPGQAKKWRRGRQLPREVIFYDLPPRLTVELGVPPPHHRFVRVASDILLIVAGTGMVVDAVEDLHDLR